MKERGQAAMEFLMTYGWAILVVLIAIGALAYFGVLSPGRFLPTTCTLAPGFACGEFKIATTDQDSARTGTQHLVIQVRNGLGATVIFVAFTTPTVINGATSCTAEADNPTTITDGATASFSFNCAGVGSVGDRFKAILNLVYTQSGQTLSHTIVGDMTSRIE